MLPRSDAPLVRVGARRCKTRQEIVVAGPGSSLTVPGIIVSEIVRALADRQPVLRIEVDLGTYATAGLHRAPSLAAANDWLAHSNIALCRVPRNARARRKAFQSLIGPEVRIAIAYAWPGIDNSWIPQFLKVAKDVGALTTVICESLPDQNPAKAVTLADSISTADRVIVGDLSRAKELTSVIGATSPVIETHRALSLGGRSGRPLRNQFAAFLRMGSVETLSTLMAAFDAIPDSRIDDYSLQVLMRYDSQAEPSIVAHSHHADHVELIGEDMSDSDLQGLCERSSAVSIADPGLDSRVFSAAIGCGIATVVLANSRLPVVGRGYVGGLLADRSQPASVHVALAHSLRLAQLGFPRPDAWDDLARRVTDMENPVKIRQRSAALGSGAQEKDTRILEPVLSFRPTIDIGLRFPGESGHQTNRVKSSAEKMSPWSSEEGSSP